MNTSSAAQKNTSFQWMTNVGVDVADVTWIESMSGSIELHMPGNRERLETIYTTALARMLASDQPHLHLLHTLN